MKNSKLLILIAASLLLSCGNNSSNSSSSSESSKNQTETVNTTKVDSTITSSETTTETTTASSTESSESSTESSTESSESSTESSESSTESSSSITEEAKYTVNFVGTEFVDADTIGTKKEFASGEEVIFSYSVTYGYKITSFTIKDASGADVEYAETSFVTFTMPASNVTVSFFTVARHTLSLTNGEHSSITVADQKDYYDEGDVVNFTVTFEEGYELDTLKVYKVMGEVAMEIEYQATETNYSFTFADMNMQIVLADKAKPVSSDPFTVKTTYQSDEWLFPNGDYNYYMYLRVVFNGDMTLSWYLSFNFEYWGGEDCAYIPPKRAAVTKPNDMPGEEFKDGQENLQYTYDQANEKITFTAAVKSSDIECSIKLNKEGNEIKTITFETQIDDEYYQTGNKTLKKI